MSIDRAFDLFRRVCDLADDERNRILDEECAGDDRLRQDVASLLQHDSEGDDALDDQFFDVGMFDEDVLTSLSTPPERIGKYRILDVLGSGGMGVVYRAEQDNPRRTVALKVLRPGLASPELMRRFEYEAQVLGRLDHPGVAKIFEAGTADTGRGAQPFFAMELVAGPTIAEWAEKEKPSTHARLQALVDVCNAVEHAHQKGIIHRDLKPSNILVRPDGRPVVLDFGIARAAETDVERTTRTRTGNIVGTLAYMSPEQAAGDPDDLDTRTDVYSLGMVFYQVLTGHLPYDVGGRTLEAALRAVREETPPSMANLDPAYRGDIETIAARALEKEKSRRYQSAAELGADIARHMRDEPITARPPGALYQLAKFARRNRVLVGSAVVITVLTLSSLVVISLLFFGERAAREEAQNERDQARVAREEAQDERDRATAARKEAQDDRDRAVAAEEQAERRRSEAERQRRIAVEVNRFLNEFFSNANPNQNPEGTRVTVVEALDLAARRLEGRFDDEPEIEAELRMTLGIAYRGLGQLEKSREQLDLALELNEDLDEDDPVRIAICNGHLGIVELLSGRTAPALALLRTALATLEAELDEHDPRVARAHLDLAVALRRAGRYDEAAGSARTALERMKDGPGPSEDRANAHGILADLARELSDYAGAERNLRRQIEILDTLGEGDDAKRTAALTHLGALLWQKTEYAEAVVVFERVAEGTRRVFGDDHYRLSEVLNNLAVAYRATGDHDSAEATLAEALPIALEHFGENHRFIGTLKNNLASVMEHRGELARAETLYREALAIQVAAIGPDHPEIATYHSNIGATIGKAGRSKEALEAFARSLEILRSHFDNDHIRVANVLYDAATVRAPDDPDGARRDLVEAERIYRLVLQDTSRDLNLGSCLEQLGLLDIKQTKWKDAATHLEEALAIFREARGVDDPHTRALMKNLASVYDTLGRPEDAARIRAPID